MNIFNQVIPSIWSNTQSFVKKIFPFIIQPFIYLWRFISKPFRLIKIHSIYFEITMLYTAILGIILVIFSGVLYTTLFRTFYTQLDQELEITAQNISQSIASYMDARGGTDESLMFAVKTTLANEGARRIRWWTGAFERSWRSRIDKMGLENYFIHFVSDTKESIAKSPNLLEDLTQGFLDNISVNDPEGINYKSVLYNQREIRIVNYPFETANGNLYTIQIGAYQKPIMDFIVNWLNSIMFSIPLILILTSFIGFLLARRILRPVNEIATTAQRITHEDLTSRVQMENPYVEMNHLIDSFNNMIGRLGNSFEHIEKFSADVAHELKTPLTVMKGESELALMEERTPKQYKAAIKTNLEEVDKMLKITEDLLLLAKLDYQPEVFRFEVFNFTEYIQEICEQAKMLAKARKIQIDTDLLSVPVMIEADKVHLRRLFFNLIHNAVKFTPQNGTISIRCTVTKFRELHVTVKDTGSGISSKDLPHIFDRFFHSDQKKSGNGLGLSIAQSIARIHGGEIKVSSVLHKGTEFTVLLPLIKS